VIRDEPRVAGEALAVAGPNLTYLTMNTGDLVHSARDRVPPEPLARLAPMVAAGRGEAAGIPFAIGRRDEGATLFRLGQPAAVVCGVCWREDRAPATWGKLLAVVDIRGVRVPLAERPPVPWLAAVLLAALLPATVERLTDVARGIARVLIEQATEW
jgi:hypothetical protein